jgi:predicted GNAT family acetyltransferase
MTLSPQVRAVDESNLAEVYAFLEQHADTSMFLLGNLDVNGPRIGPVLNSGNCKLIEIGSQVCAVFCLTRRTVILAEAGGRAEFAHIIVDACRQESIPIGGVMGEWPLAEAIWSILESAPGFREVCASKEILQALDLSHVTRHGPDAHVRHLRADDFEQWAPLNAGFSAEEGIPLPGTPDERERVFRRSAESGRWWGYFENDRLVAMACLNAVYKRFGQVGGVYTVPTRRGLGFSRATMNALLADSVHVHGLKRLILFTGEHNEAARHIYKTLGFSTIGDFALLMCAPMP